MMTSEKTFNYKNLPLKLAFIKEKLFLDIESASAKIGKFWNLLRIYTYGHSR